MKQQAIVAHERRIIRRLEARGESGLGDALVRLDGAIVGRRFRIESLYAVGSEGAVYLARDLEDTDAPMRVAKVALLPLHRPFDLTDEELLRRRDSLREEATNLARSDSRYMPQSLGLFHFQNPALETEWGGEFGEPEPCLVMEKIPGFDLDLWLARMHSSRVPKVLLRRQLDHVAVVVLSALMELQDRGYFYTDLRPGNVRIRGRSKERVRLLDAGSLVRVEDLSGKFPHVPAYLPPELFETSHAGGLLLPTPAVQAVMAGRTLFEVATGRVPLPGEPVETAALYGLTVSPSVAETVERLCRGSFPDVATALAYLSENFRHDASERAAAPAAPARSVASAHDAARPARDAARPARDAARPARDAARPARDAARPARDAARPARDAARPARDGAAERSVTPSPAREAPPSAAPRVSEPQPVTFSLPPAKPRLDLHSMLASARQAPAAAERPASLGAVRPMAAKGATAAPAPRTAERPAPPVPARPASPQVAPRTVAPVAIPRAAQTTAPAPSAQSVARPAQSAAAPSSARSVAPPVRPAKQAPAVKRVDDPLDYEFAAQYAAAVARGEAPPPLKSAGPAAASAPAVSVPAAPVPASSAPAPVTAAAPSFPVVSEALPPGATHISVLEPITSDALGDVALKAAAAAATEMPRPVARPAQVTSLPAASVVPLAQAFVMSPPPARPSKSPRETQTEFDEPSPRPSDFVSARPAPQRPAPVREPAPRADGDITQDGELILPPAAPRSRLARLVERLFRWVRRQP